MGCTSFFYGLVFVICIVFLVHSTRNRKSRLPYAPGPPREFLLGNLRSLPTSLMWLTYEIWAKTYGDVMYLRAMNQGILVLSSLAAAKELLERKSTATSDRPRFTMIAELMGWSWAIQFQDMSPRFRHYRRALQSSMNPKILPTYIDIVERRSVDLLASLLDNPHDKFATVKHHIGGLTMTILYGEQPGNVRDQYVENAESAVDGLVEAGNVGKFLVDTVPILKYVPEWCPGAEFKRKAREWRHAARTMIEVPYKDAKKRYDNGKLPVCVTKMLLDSQLQGDEGTYYRLDEELVMSCAGVLFVGAADTALSTLYSFLYAMVMHPDVQHLVHEEITTHIGSERLPTLEDRPLLKYLECVYLETLRWMPAVPLGVPHYTQEDCIIGEYHVPKGTIILVNQWAILRNESTYADAAVFRPERFLPTEGYVQPPDPRDASFGYGRRGCPGKNFANQFLWLMMARLAATFVFEKARDADGSPIEPSGELVSSMITRPIEFAFDVLPRSEALAAQVRKVSVE